MKFAEDLSDNGYIVTAYDKRSVDVNGKRFEQSFIISSDTFQEAWPVNTITELCSEHLTPIIDLQPEIIIMGTGRKLIFPAVETYAALIRNNIGIEFMDTGAACRTYNILTGEGRKVVAGMILE